MTLPSCSDISVHRILDVDSSPNAVAAVKCFQHKSISEAIQFICIATKVVYCSVEWNRLRCALISEQQTENYSIIEMHSSAGVRANVKRMGRWTSIDDTSTLDNHLKCGVSLSSAQRHLPWFTVASSTSYINAAAFSRGRETVSAIQTYFSGRLNQLEDASWCHLICFYRVALSMHPVFDKYILEHVRLCSLHQIIHKSRFSLSGI